jgi:general nucleoside transport system ATP-binding protein
LALNNITKVFPHPEKPVVANDDVSFDLRRGEIHALVGENGTGKTTLMNILYGLLPPDRGEIVLNGRAIRVKNTREAISRGIGMVHQHFMLVPSFTVAENLVFASEPMKGVFVDARKAVEITGEISSKYGLFVDPHKRIADCPLSMQQRVEILKILLRGANILIFDEPTAVLTPQESQELFNAFGELKKAGKSIIFITHRLREVIAVADRATVMRKGKVVGTVDIPASSLEELAQMMVGRRVDLLTRKNKKENNDRPEGGKDILIFDEVSTGRSTSGIRLSNVSFSVKEGEILGIAGVGGNGQEQVVECVTGLTKSISGGSLLYRERDIAKYGAHKIRDIGIAHITGDRYGRGISAKSTVHDNLIMGAHRRAPWVSGPFLRRGKLRELSDRLMLEYDIKASSRSVSIMNLSGGNIQKCVFARELNLAKDLIIAEEPTRGVDIGSIEFIHNQLVEKVKAGFGVLLVSTDLDEILSLSSRVLVMFAGEIVGEVDPEEEGIERKIGLLMAGIRQAGESGAA